MRTESPGPMPITRTSWVLPVAAASTVLGLWLTWAVVMNDVRTLNADVGCLPHLSCPLPEGEVYWALVVAAFYAVGFLGIWVADTVMRRRSARSGRPRQ